MKYSPIPTAYPSITNATWTMVNTIHGKDRRYFLMANMDTSTVYRFLKLARPEGVTLAAWTTTVRATYGATAGKILPVAAGSGYVGGVEEETYNNLSSGDIWVYQASGTTKTTLAVDEGQ